MCWYIGENAKDEKCFLNVRLIDAKIKGIFETTKMFNKNISKSLFVLHLNICV